MPTLTGNGFETQETPPGIKPRIIVGIPAYNEEEFIAAVVKGALNHAEEVLVIDDGSVDNTRRVAEAAGAVVIRRPRNQGVGRANRALFEYARQHGAEVLVTIDGDGQHHPGEIPALLEPVIGDDADLVIGSRFLGKRSRIPEYRKLGINLITFLLNFASSVKVTDSQCCFRAYSRRALERLTVNERGFPFSIELLLKARKLGLNIAEVPIGCVYHEASHTKNPVAHGIEVASSVILLRIKSLHTG